MKDVMRVLYSKLIRRYLLIKHFLKIQSIPTVWISLGENCLTDNILQRHEVKSFSTPFSHGRSNLDYLLFLEKCNYKGFLEEDNLEYQMYYSLRKVVRSTLVNKCDNIYQIDHMQGVEFTHHDILGSPEARKSIVRKVKRLQNLKGRKNFVFFYHYRLNDNFDLHRIIKKAEDFCKSYITNYKKVVFIIFSQNLVKEKRGLQYKQFSENVHYFQFDTLKPWTGNDNEVFWAKVDDDLIHDMIKKMKDYTHTW